MTNQSMIQQSLVMQIYFVVLLFAVVFHEKSFCSNSSCVSCSAELCYQCFNTLPRDRTHVDRLQVICNSSESLFQPQERFYSIIQSFTTIRCSMKTLYFDQFTLWNYLEYLSITSANLTRFSPKIFNRSLSSSSPVLYSIKTLNLSSNSIRILNRNFSYYFPSLEKLDLSHNHLVLIRKKTFLNLIYLKELYLNDNYLKQILPNILPRQSLHLINLNGNHWHCSCANVLILSTSRPIPLCHTPKEYRNQNASSIARQCFLRTKANILVTIKTTKVHNVTCILSTIAEEWKVKINRNLSLISAWHIEQGRSISPERLSVLKNTSDMYLLCFNLNSTYPEAIETIIPLASRSINLTTSPSLVIRSSSKLSPVFLWLLKISKTILPKRLQSSDRYVLIIWLILLLLAVVIFLLLVYFIHQHQTNEKSPLKSKSRSFIRFDRNLPDHRTLFNVKFTCQNHKCLCQYRRRAHSTLYLTKSTSSTLLEPPLSAQPAFIEPNQLRYAKIKRISSSTNKFEQEPLTGQFRTIVKLRTLPI